MRRFWALLVAILLTCNSWASIVYSVDDGDRRYLIINKDQGRYWVSSCRVADCTVIGERSFSDEEMEALRKELRRKAKLIWLLDAGIVVGAVALSIGAYMLAVNLYTSHYPQVAAKLAHVSKGRFFGGLPVDMNFLYERSQLTIKQFVVSASLFLGIGVTSSVVYIDNRYFFNPARHSRAADIIDQALDGEEIIHIKVKDMDKFVESLIKVLLKQ